MLGLLSSLKPPAPPAPPPEPPPPPPAPTTAYETKLLAEQVATEHTVKVPGPVNL